MPQKTALVFGCNGQDGSLLCKSLLQQGFKVIGTTRDINKDMINLKKINIDREIEIIELSLNNQEFLKNIIEVQMPHEIYHLSAQSSVGKSFLKTNETFDSIISSTINILEACRAFNLEQRCFFAGSSEIFGNTKQAATINTSKDLRSPYAIGKDFCLNLVKFYRENYHINCVTGILFNHESPLRNENYVTHKIITGAVKSSLDKNHKIQLGNINISRDWGWAEEYIEAIQLIVREKKQNDHIICTGKLTSLIDFINMAYSMMNLNWEDHVLIDDSLKRKNDINISFGNPNELEKSLNWKAKINIEEIIQKLLKTKIEEFS